MEGRDSGGALCPLGPYNSCFSHCFFVTRPLQRVFLSVPRIYGTMTCRVTRGTDRGSAAVTQCRPHSGGAETVGHAVRGLSCATFLRGRAAEELSGGARFSHVRAPVV